MNVLNIKVRVRAACLLKFDLMTIGSNPEALAMRRIIRIHHKSGIPT
jgi:hypothetical protein